jgi:dTMP kinase
MDPTPSPADAARGRFIVLEGIDGAGTTTQLKALEAHFARTERKAVFTHQPSDGPVGMLIRLALHGRLVGANFESHDPEGGEATAPERVDVATLALLFAADRADHVATQVRPNLAKGRHVVCDRYLLSTLAYQGLEMDEEWLVRINRPALVPDLTLFLDLPSDVAGERMRRARWRKERYEGGDEQREIRQRYLDVIGHGYPAVGPVVRIDASDEQHPEGRRGRRGVIGGAIGAVIGHNTGSTARGAIIGAVVGGAAGAVIGHQMDRQAHDLEGDLGQNAEVSRVGEGIAVTFASGILFPFNSDDVLPAGRENLRQLAQSLQRYPGTEVLIVGHTGRMPRRPLPARFLATLSQSWERVAWRLASVRFLRLAGPHPAAWGRPPSPANRAGEGTASRAQPGFGACRGALSPLDSSRPSPNHGRG